MITGRTTYAAFALLSWRRSASRKLQGRDVEALAQRSVKGGRGLDPPLIEVQIGVPVIHEYIDEALADRLLVLDDQDVDLSIHQTLRLPVHAFLVQEQM